MDWSTFLGISMGYVITQFIFVKLLKKEPPDPFGFLFITLFVTFLNYIFNAMIYDNWSMPFHDFLSIIAGCSVGQFITGKIFGRQEPC